MIAIFLQIFPFFAIIGLGFFGTRSAVISEQAAAGITKFVFYFALPAMIFEFSSRLDIGQVFDGRFVLSYWLAGILLYIFIFAVARLRKVDATTAAVEAQCSVFANSGFMAIPILLGLFGEKAAGPLLLVLAVDMIFYSSLMVIMITSTRAGGLKLESIRLALVALVKNPMILAMPLGLFVSVLDIAIPNFISATTTVLGDAATPCALFAIGASLARKSAERLSTAIWLSTAKLIFHPLLTAFFALLVFKIEPFAATIMIAVTAMPTANNIFILADRYNAAPRRVSSAILVSTICSIFTLTIALKWLGA